MVKAYLRYEPATTFGVIVFVDSNITYDSSSKHLLAPALEKLRVWHVRQGVCVQTLTPSPSSCRPSLAVSSVASSSSSLEWSKPRTGRRHDAVPQFSPMRTPLPPAVPCDVPAEDAGFAEDEEEEQPLEEPLEDDWIEEELQF